MSTSYICGVCSHSMCSCAGLAFDIRNDHIDKLQAELADKELVIQYISKNNLAMGDELEKERERRVSANKLLRSCKAAMTYAYEDMVDQYYLNVKNLIEDHFKKYEGDKGE